MSDPEFPPKSRKEWGKARMVRNSHRERKMTRGEY